jgi:putative DNA primase/helicase
VEQDIIERFIEECCFTNSSCTVSSSDLWQAFKTWAGDSGEYVGTQTAFGRRITAKGFERGKSSRTYYHGIGLLTQGS